MKPKPDAALRIGVIGAGDHSSKHHLPALARFLEIHPGAIRLAALCDRDRERAEAAASEFGFEHAFTGIDTMLEEISADAIVAITPVSITAATAHRLFEYGRPFLIEKPPAGTVEEACELLALQQRTGVPVMVSMNRRHDPAFTAVRERIAGRPIRGASVQFLRADRRDPDFLFETGIHFIDTLRAACGPIRRQQFHPDNPEDPRQGRLEIVFENGTEGEATINPRAGRHEESYRFEGEGFTASFCAGGQSFPESGSWEFREAGSEQRFNGSTGSVRPPRYTVDGTWHETVAFVEMAGGTGQPRPGLGDTLGSLRAAIALQNG